MTSADRPRVDDAASATGTADSPVSIASVDSAASTAPTLSAGSTVLWLADRWPHTIEPDPGLARALSFLGWDVDDRAAAAAASALGSAVGLVAGGFALVYSVGSGRPIGVGLPVGLLVGLLSGWGTTVVCVRAPVLAAAAVRTRAVADAAGVVGALALSLRLTPAPERAVRFAARSGEGALHRSLRRHAERAAVTGDPDAGLTAFRDEWSERFPALERSVGLLLAASNARAGADRDRLLDRAVAAVEDDLRDRASSFAGELRGPVTGLYAFGVLLPLALVGTLPAAVAAGLPVPPALFVAVYGLLLPAGLVAAGGGLLLRRPVAFPPARVGRSHPELSDRRPAAVGAGVVAAAVGWLVAGAVVGGWAGPVAAAGVGVGTGLAVRLGPTRAIRRDVDERERGFPDALALLGRRVAAGDSVERALPAVARTLSGPAGEALATADRRRRGLGVTVDEALAGSGAPFGPRRAGGARTRGALSAVSAAVSEGRPAGEALVAHAERLDALAASERAARRELASVTGTLRETAALYGPLVGGATVALAGRLGGLEGISVGGSVSTAAAPALSPSFVGPAVGVYVLLLAATLTALATGLERGLDATVVAYRVGIALVTAVGAFLAGHVAVALLVG